MFVDRHSMEAVRIDIALHAKDNIAFGIDVHSPGRVERTALRSVESGKSIDTVGSLRDCRDGESPRYRP